jgi:hypothetical protein
MNSLRDQTTPTYKKKAMRGVGVCWDCGLTELGRRTRRAMRRKSYGKVRVGRKGIETVGWASMKSLICNSPFVSASLRQSEGGNPQERMIKGVGEAE